ncbi:MAG: peptidylprolyl isomerase [Bacillota bacterium]
MAVLVNGEKIDDNQIQREAQQIKQYYEQNVPNSEDIKDKKILEVARENAIKRTLLMQEAKAMDIKVTEDEIDREFNQMKQRYGGNVKKEQIKSDLILKIKYSKLLDKIVEQVEEPEEEEIKEIYENNKEHFKNPPQIHAAHIVKKANKNNKEQVLNKMQEIKDKLDQGESFKKLANKHSDCNDDGGDLGFFPRGKMVPKFEDVVFDLDPGEVSDVFLTQFGYHIAKVYDKKKGEDMSFEEAKKHIVREQFNRKKSIAIEQYAEKLKEDSQIEEI